MVYGSGIPILYPFSMLNLLVRYWINKWLILRYSSKILGLTPHYIRVVLKFFTPACLLSLMVAIWMYTAKIPYKLLEEYNWFVFISNGYLYRFIFISFLPILGLGIAGILVFDYILVSWCE